MEKNKKQKQNSTKSSVKEPPKRLACNFSINPKSK